MWQQKMQYSALEGKQGGDKMKYRRAIALLVMHYCMEKEHIDDLKKKKRKREAVKERIAEGEYEQPELLSAIKFLLKE